MLDRRILKESTQIFFFKRFLSSEKDWTSWRIVEMRNSKCAKDHTQNMHYKNRVLHIDLFNEMSVPNESDLFLNDSFKHLQ